MIKNLPANTGDVRDMGSFSRLIRSPGGGSGNLLQYSCLENPMGKGAWQATVHKVTKNQIQLKPHSTHTCMQFCGCNKYYFKWVKFIINELYLKRCILENVGAQLSSWIIKSKTSEERLSHTPS